MVRVLNGNIYGKLSYCLGMALKNTLVLKSEVSCKTGKVLTVTKLVMNTRGLIQFPLKLSVAFPGSNTRSPTCFCPEHSYS